MVVELKKDQLTVDTSGKNGNAGARGDDGSNGYSGAYGQNGHDGKDGKDGHHAENIHVTLSAEKYSSTMSVKVESDSQAYQLPLDSGKTTVNLFAKGGDGGHGGHGGNGGDGGHGPHGHDATEHSHGTDGGPGGDGGHGGDGGKGGKSGDGADVTAEIQDEKDLDLFKTIHFKTKAGNPGKGGKGSDGGKGGRGGEGGNSHSWTSYTYTTDGDGVTHTHMHSHSNLGGHRGRNGNDGKDGKHGKNGERGHDGQMTFLVNKKAYHERYDVNATYFAPITSDDGVIEPGETLVVTGLTLENPTQMPTPSLLEVSVEENTTITFSAEHTLETPTINPNQKRMFTDALNFSIKPNAHPAVDTTFVEYADVNVNVRLPRVKQDFENVMEPSTLQVRYPVESSTASRVRTIPPKGEAPFAIKLKNISDFDLGESTPTHRPVQLILSVVDGISCKDFEFYYPEKNITANFAAPLQFYIPILEKRSYTTLAGTLKFLQEYPPYTKVKLRAELRLGNLHTNQLETIQVRNFDVQLANSYQYVPEADWILVTNHKTDENIIKAYQDMAKSVGTRVSIFNTSLYEGLSYTQKLTGEESFVTQAQGKVVIILNNDFQTNKNATTKSTKYLDQMEMFVAAKQADLSTYVVGNKFNFEKATTPAQNIAGATDKKSTLHKSLIFFSKPKEQHLIQQAERINKNESKRYPSKTSLTVYDYKPEKIKGCFINTWELGEIEIRANLPKDRAHIAHREGNVGSPDKLDLYNIIKLASFDKKLNYLLAAHTNAEQLQIIKSAILSDLASELHAYGEHTWKGEFSKTKLRDALVCLNKFATRDYQAFPNELPGKNTFLELLLTYEYLAKHIQDAADKYLFPWCKRRHMLSDIGVDTIKLLLHKYYPDADVVELHRQTIANQYRNKNKVEIFNAIMNPQSSENVKIDSQYNQDKVMPRDKTPAYSPHKSHFKENVGMFKNNSQRLKAIEKQQKNCEFELKEIRSNLGLNK